MGSSLNFSPSLPSCSSFASGFCLTFAPLLMRAKSCRALKLLPPYASTPTPLHTAEP
jgi:hypothetical protein